MRRFLILFGLALFGFSALPAQETAVSVLAGSDYLAVQANVDGLWGFRVGRLDETVCTREYCRRCVEWGDDAAGVYEAMVYVPIHKRWSGYVAAGVVDWQDELDPTGGAGVTYTWKHLAVTGGYQSAAGAVGGLGWSARW